MTQYIPPDPGDNRNPEPRRLYRSRNGLILGVCKGLAEYLGIGTGLVRFIAVVLFLTTGFWPVGVIYLALGLVLDKAPQPNPEPGASPLLSRAEKLRGLQKRMEQLDGRIRRMEDTVTHPSFDWEKRLRRPS